MTLLLTEAPVFTAYTIEMPEGPAHIEKACGDLREPITRVVMECGVTCVIDEDGDVLPDEFEWVFPYQATQATCVRCRAACGL